MNSTNILYFQIDTSIYCSTEIFMLHYYVYSATFWCFLCYTYIIQPEFVRILVKFSVLYFALPIYYFSYGCAFCGVEQPDFDCVVVVFVMSISGVHILFHDVSILFYIFCGSIYVLGFPFLAKNSPLYSPILFQ